MSLFFRIALSIISAVLFGMATSIIAALLVLPAAAALKEAGAATHGVLFVSFRDAPTFLGITVFLAILCRDARSEYLSRD